MSVNPQRGRTSFVFLPEISVVQHHAFAGGNDAGTGERDKQVLGGDGLNLCIGESGGRRREPIQCAICEGDAMARGKIARECRDIGAIVDSRGDRGTDGRCGRQTACETHGRAFRGSGSKERVRGGNFRASVDIHVIHDDYTATRWIS